MTDHQLVLQATRYPQPAANTRRPQIVKQILFVTFASSVAALSIIGTAAAEAKQQCSVAPASKVYWSWRLIDGRKCWYKGRAMISKTLLEWPTQTTAKPERGAEVATARPQKLRDPLDAQALVPDDSATFEARWQSRIETPQVDVRH